MWVETLDGEYINMNLVGCIYINCHSFDYRFRDQIVVGADINGTSYSLKAFDTATDAKAFVKELLERCS